MVATTLSVQSTRLGAVRDTATAVPGTNVETVVATTTVGSNILMAGSLIEFRMGFGLATVVSAGTLALRLRWMTPGAAPTTGDLLWSHTAINPADSLALSIDFDSFIVVRSIAAGALPVFQTTGHFLLSTTAGASLQQIANEVNMPATLSQNVPRAIALTGQISAGADVVQLTNGFVRISRPSAGFTIATP